MSFEWFIYRIRDLLQKTNCLKRHFQYSTILWYLKTIKSVKYSACMQYRWQSTDFMTCKIMYPKFYTKLYENTQFCHVPYKSYKWNLSFVKYFLILVCIYQHSYQKRCTYTRMSLTFFLVFCPQRLIKCNVWNYK